MGKRVMKNFWMFVAVLMMAVLAVPSAWAQSDLQKQADAAWDEKSYARALELYQKIAASGTASDSDELNFRIAVALGKTEKWDAAFAAGEKLASNTPWKARVFYWLGRLYTVVPHNGYKVDGKVYRGDDYPKIEGAEKPTQTWLQDEDASKTLEYFERAKIAARSERNSNAVPSHALTSAEEIDLNFDLAAFLPTREQPQYLEKLKAAIEKGQKLDETIDLAQTYNRDWNLPTKVLYLYNEIAKLDQSKDNHKTALSLLVKGMFVASYRQTMDSWANQYDEKLKKYVKREYPFDHLEAIPYWQQVVTDYASDPIAPQTQILIGQTYQQQNDLVKALAAFQLLLDKFPKSKWINDAKAQIQQITRKELRVDSIGQQPPGKNASLNVNTRNVKRVEFAAYRVKLEDVLLQAGKLNTPNNNFQSFDGNFGSIAQAKQYFGEQVAKWSYDAKDKGDYQSTYETIQVPLKDIGAYMITASSGNLRFAQVLVVSDLALIKKTDRDSAFVYVADAQSGEPVMNANVVMKEIYWNSGASRVDVARGKSDELGFFDKKLARGANIGSSNVGAFAWVGDRYALTQQSYAGYYGDNREEAKVYAYTDRPVYRPGQKVYFRQILTSRVKGGDQAPLKGVPVQVTVNNPKGEEIYKQTLTSSEFGTINGEFNLPDETPLGEYSINANLNQTPRNIAAYGSSRFRVEEYKRPEFMVNVDAPDHAVRPGETVAAKVNVKYYFGAPVPNAKVKYTVRKSTWWASYEFPRPYAWLWKYWGVGDYDTGRRNIGGEGSGEIIKQGETTTDSKGNAEVNFQTKPDTDDANKDDWNYWWRRYSNPRYTIEIEATDASRRTIEGQGEVRVANQQYFAFLDTKHGFYQSGDRIPFELVTQDANNKPLSASGKMVVYKELPGDKEEKVFESAVQTDKQGRTFWTWENDASGQFRIAYEATDDWGKDVRASANIWVAGDGLNTTALRLQGVTIVVEKRYYEEGDTAKVLLVADQPNTTVLFTQEASGDVLKRELVHIAGKSKEVSITIGHEHVPNFAVAAALVKNFEIYQTQQEIFVPPVQQLLNVSVKGDKSEYKPGDKGTLTLKATDWKGNPVRTELSVALTDASLFYIQKSYTPEIRTFYYGERRATSVQLDSSKGISAGLRMEDDNVYQRFEQHGWEMPDDMGLLNLTPGQFGWWGGYDRRRYRGGPRNEMQFAARMSDDAVSAPAMGGAMPAAAPIAMMKASAETAKGDKDGEGALATAQVRSNFAETAFWSPAVVTENGEAKVEVTFPDSLTQWHAEARGLSQTAQVGSAETDVETKKDLLVRLQAPRFFTERDQVVLTANVHNYFKTAKRVKVSLETSDQLRLMPKAGASNPVAKPQEEYDMLANSGFITVKAGEEARVNWTVEVVRVGQAEVQMTAQSDEEADAVKMKFPVMVHGVQRFSAESGVMREGAAKQVVKINTPKERKFGASTLNVQLNPSIAATMMDALPYLADYPYGCVEQTMSRFLPSVVTRKVLADSGVELSTLAQRAKAYEKEAQEAPRGNRVENTGYTYPKGMPNARDLKEMSSRLWHTGRWSNPVYDQSTLDAMVKDGLDRLYNMQRSDGGWGWWSGSSYSDEYMSAYVVYGLATARAADVKVRDDVLNRGYSYLQAQMKDEDNLHLLTWIAFALSQRGKLPSDVAPIVAGRLFEQRERLSAYSKSLLALTLWNTGEKEKAGVLVRNLENTAKLDAQNGTARWQTGSQWWCWWNNDVETTAWALRAFLKVDPTNKLTPMLMKWLTARARGNHWNSTKETAAVVYALADYVRVNKELDVDYTVTVTLNGELRRTYHVNKDNALFFDNRFVTGDIFLNDGENTLTIEKRGKGSLYWTAASEYFSLEEPIKAAGYEMAIKRRYFKLTPTSSNTETAVAEGNKAQKPVAGAAVRGMRPILPIPRPRAEVKQEYSRSEIRDGETLKSGDLIEVELTIDAKNDYEYLVFEDMKPAGMEPVEIRSGSAWGDGLSSNVELRDEKVAMFVDRLPQGTRVLRYRMRAEIPGRFHALPTNGYAMYAPEVRAISDEQRINVED
jgi:uncharacterized protein YfaS (alpha-2-macroglobulin family)